MKRKLGESSLIEVLQGYQLNIDRMPSRLIRNVEKTKLKAGVAVNMSHLAHMTAYQSGVDFTIVVLVLRSFFEVIVHYLKAGYLVNLFRLGFVHLKFSRPSAHSSRTKAVSLPKPIVRFKKNPCFEVAIGSSITSENIEQSEELTVKRINQLKRDLQLSAEVTSKALKIERSEDGKTYCLRDQNIKNPKKKRTG